MFRLGFIAFAWIQIITQGIYLCLEMGLCVSPLRLRFGFGRAGCANV